MRGTSQGRVLLVGFFIMEEMMKYKGKPFGDGDEKIRKLLGYVRTQTCFDTEIILEEAIALLLAIGVFSDTVLKNGTPSLIGILNDIQVMGAEVQTFNVKYFKEAHDNTLALEDAEKDR